MLRITVSIGLLVSALGASTLQAQAFRCTNKDHSPSHAATTAKQMDELVKSKGCAGWAPLLAYTESDDLRYAIELMAGRKASTENLISPIWGIHGNEEGKVLVSEKGDATGKVNAVEWKTLSGTSPSFVWSVESEGGKVVVKKKKADGSKEGTFTAFRGPDGTLKKLKWADFRTYDVTTFTVDSTKLLDGSTELKLVDDSTAEQVRAVRLADDGKVVSEIFYAKEEAIGEKKFNYSKDGMLESGTVLKNGKEIESLKFHYSKQLGTITREGSFSRAE